MPWREGLVVVFGLMVGGCLFSAYQIASLTATGISYVFSGKSLGDNALSLAMNKDCATLRVLEGEEVCVEYEEEHDDSWSAMASNWKIPEPDSQSHNIALAGNPDDPVDAPIVVAAKAPDEPSFVPAAAGAGDNTVSKTNPKRRGLDFEGLVIPDWVVPQPQSNPWPKQAFSPRGVDFDGLVAGDKEKSDLLTVPVAVREPLRPEPAIYLVLGSFRKLSNAERLGAKHSGVRTAVSSIEADGRTLHRLLAGPYESSALAAARARLAKAGIRNSWGVKLCRASLTVPPCKPILQQAALP